jgi:hypothetical protein
MVADRVDAYAFVNETYKKPPFINDEDGQLVKQNMETIFGVIQTKQKSGSI